MNNIEALLATLLEYDKVLTIYKADDGIIMISFSDVESNQDGPIFVPEHTMLTRSPLNEALAAFSEHQQMRYHRGFQA